MPANPPTAFDRSGAELLRAARVLSIRSRREATGLFAGNYRSAFRGGGLEFEESRPYLPGDDVRTIDWNATARCGRAFVKRYREERDLTLLLALDVSASMRFGGNGRSKAATAAHAVALLAAASGRAGDRVGFFAFGALVCGEVPVGHGDSHGFRVVREAARAACASGGGTSLSAAIARLSAFTRQRAVAIVFSDFRGGEIEGLRRELTLLARRHDVVAGVISDPLEEALPDVGSIRIADPERPDASFTIDTSRARVRERYREAAAARRSDLLRQLRSAGVDPLWIRTDRSPYYALGHFFQQRAGRREPAIR